MSTDLSEVDIHPVVTGDKVAVVGLLNLQFDQHPVVLRSAHTKRGTTQCPDWPFSNIAVVMELTEHVSSCYNQLLGESCDVRSLKVKDIMTGVRVLGYSLTCTMPGNILDSLVPVGRETQCCRKVFGQCKSRRTLDLPSIW